MTDPKKFIRVNLPLTEQDYLSGNGEGVWVKVDESTRAAYDANLTGPGYCGVLDNDSLYYPRLACGAPIPFELRGQLRPVADFPGFLCFLPKLTPEEKAALLRKIAAYQNDG